MRKCAKFYTFWAWILLMLGITSCSQQQQAAKKKPVEAPSLTSQSRLYQNYTLRSSDLKKAMKATVMVLQDSGFVITSCALDLGVITARKETDIEKTGDRSFNELIDGPGGRWAKVRIIDTTIDIFEDEGELKLKATFQSKVLDNRGAVLSIDQIEDEGFYNEFFMKIKRTCAKLVQLAQPRSSNSVQSTTDVTSNF